VVDRKGASQLLFHEVPIRHENENAKLAVQAQDNSSSKQVHNSRAG
jgi:hypothetical protein